MVRPTLAMKCVVAARQHSLSGGVSYRRLKLIGRQGSDALPTIAGLLIKVMQQTCPRILADYLRTAEPQTPSDPRKRADSDVKAELHDVAVGHDVFLAFNSNFSGRFCRGH